MFMHAGARLLPTYARTRVERGFFPALFRPKHRKISRKWPEMVLFFSLRETQVARNSGDIPV